MDDHTAITYLDLITQMSTNPEAAEVAKHAIAAIRELALIRRAWDVWAPNICGGTVRFTMALGQLLDRGDPTALKKLAGETHE